jgi:hypothetical protein
MNDIEMAVAYHPTPWNKGKLIGQKPPLKLREIWTLRTRLEMAGKTKELGLFNLAIDSKLRGCDLQCCPHPNGRGDGPARHCRAIGSRAPRSSRIGKVISMR